MTPCFALGQTAKATRRTAGPLETVRQFYAWYLHRLNKEDYKPLKNRTIALRYLTPEFLRSEPRFRRAMEADVVVCSQDVDPAWENSFDVKMFGTHGHHATVLLALSRSEFEGPLQYKVRLQQTRAGWRIGGVDCNGVANITY